MTEVGSIEWEYDLMDRNIELCYLLRKVRNYMSELAVEPCIAYEEFPNELLEFVALIDIELGKKG